MLPSRCALDECSKASPTGPKSSQQVRSEPACISVMGCTKPGVASVQAVWLNLEICIVAVERITSPDPRGGKPTPWSRRKAAVLSCDKASEGGYRRGLRAGHVRRGATRELGRAHCFLDTIAGKRRATGLPKGPGVDGAFPRSQRALRGDTKIRETARYRGASDE